MASVTKKSEVDQTEGTMTKEGAAAGVAIGTTAVVVAGTILTGGALLIAGGVGALLGAAFGAKMEESPIIGQGSSDLSEWHDIML